MKTASFSLLLSLMAAFAAPGFSAPAPQDEITPPMQSPAPGEVIQNPPAHPTDVGPSKLGRSLEGRVNVDVVLPQASQDFLCNTQDNSPGTSNIDVAIEELKKLDDDKICAPGDNGANVAMVRGGMYSTELLLTR